MVCFCKFPLNNAFCTRVVIVFKGGSTFRKNNTLLQIIFVNIQKFKGSSFFLPPTNDLPEIFKFCQSSELLIRIWLEDRNECFMGNTA